LLSAARFCVVQNSANPNQANAKSQGVESRSGRGVDPSLSTMLRDRLPT
jgi:hypothetical protein